MAEMNYSNPAEWINPQSFGGQDQFGGTNAFTAYYASQKAALAKAALERMGQSQDLERQKQTQLMQEFMSPQGIAGRAAKQEAETATAQGTTRGMPSKIDAEIAVNDALIKNAGPEAEAKKNKAILEINKLKGTQEEGFLVNLADFGVQLRDSKATDFDKIEAYNRHVDRLMKQFPDASIDPKLRNWNVNTATNLAILQRAFLEDTKHKQMVALEKERSTAAMERQKEQTRSAAGVAGTAAAVTKRGQDLQYGSKEEMNNARIEKVISDAQKADSMISSQVLNLIGADDAEYAKIEARIDARKKKIRDEIVGESSKPRGAALSKQEVESAGGTYDPGYEYFKFPDGSIKRRKKK